MLTERVLVKARVLRKAPWLWPREASFFTPSSWGLEVLLQKEEAFRDTGLFGFARNISGSLASLDLPKNDLLKGWRTFALLLAKATIVIFFYYLSNLQ